MLSYTANSRALRHAIGVFYSDDRVSLPDPREQCNRFRDIQREFGSLERGFSLVCSVVFGSSGSKAHLR